MHVGDSPVEGHARDSAAKKEGDAIAVDTMSQDCDLGESDGGGGCVWGYENRMEGILCTVS